MAKKKTKIELQVTDELCRKAMTLLNAARTNVEAIEETEKTREISLGKTKIDEAYMWLERYYADIMIDPANKTCI